jgi:hypothetical protein
VKIATVSCCSTENLIIMARLMIVLIQKSEKILS